MVNSNRKNIVIIGGGIAAINAVKAIREIDNEISIDLFGNERYYPYYRIRLSKSLLGKLDEESIILQKKDWYELNKINLHLNARVVGINTEKKEVLLSNDERVKYDKLLIASGADNNVPKIEGINKRKVFTLRNLEDAYRIRECMDNSNTILYIGGGIQGLEIALSLKQQNKNVILAEIQSRLMPRQLDEDASNILQEMVKRAGVQILLDTEVENILGEAHVTAIQTKSGLKFDCDMVLYSVGPKPNIDFVLNTPIKINRGIAVDQKMLTNVEDVYAAGDVAEFEGRLSGLWSIAMEQGKVAGYNMVGHNVMYNQIVPVTNLNAYGITLFSMGKVDTSSETQTITEKDTDRLVYKKIFIENNNIVGAIAVGDIGKSPILKMAIEKKVSLEGIDIGNISIDELLERIRK